MGSPLSRWQSKRSCVHGIETQRIHCHQLSRWVQWLGGCKKYLYNINMIQITEKLSIPLRELKFVATTGSGPGGQHVNRVATKIVLLWNVDLSKSISNSQRSRIKRKLTTRINKLGILRISSSKHRSQKANRSVTIERFVQLLREALKRKHHARKRGSPLRRGQSELTQKSEEV